MFRRKQKYFVGVSAKYFKLAAGGLLPATIAHIARVQADGGIIDDPVLCNEYFKFKKNNAFMADTLIDAIPSVLGYKMGSTDFTVQKSYSSINTGAGDISQTFAANQPLIWRYTGERYLGGINNTYAVPSGYTPIDNAGNNNLEIIVKTDQVSRGSLWSLASTVFVAYPTCMVQDTNASVVIYHSGVTYNFAANITVNQQYYIKFNWNGVHVGKLAFSNDGITWGADIPVNFTGGGASYNLDQLQVACDAYYGGTGVKVYDFSYTDNTLGYTIDLGMNNYNPAFSEIIWLANTGQTWTISRSIGVSGYKTTGVIRTKFQYTGISNDKLGIFGLPLGAYTDAGQSFTMLTVNTWLSNFNWAILSSAFSNINSVWIGVDNGTILEGLGKAGATFPLGGFSPTVNRNYAGKHKVERTTGQLVTSRKNNSAGVNYSLFGIDTPDGSVTDYLFNQYASYSGSPYGSNTEYNAYMFLSSKISDADETLLTDFLNSTVFNNELY